MLNEMWISKEESSERFRGEGAAWHRGSILASHPPALGIIPSVPKKLAMLLMLINSTG